MKPRYQAPRGVRDILPDEIDRWHPPAGEEGSALVHAAIVPRFSLSVTTRTLAALGELYDAYRGRGVYFTSHLNENNRPGDGEIDAVKSLYEVDSYLDTYDGLFMPGSKRGGKTLLGRRSVMAHCVHCTDDELHRLASAETAVGSGLLVTIFIVPDCELSPYSVPCGPASASTRLMSIMRGSGLIENCVRGCSSM